MELPECDFDDPETVVATFVRAMNAWELSAARLQKEEAVMPWEKLHSDVGAIFARFCTQKDRPYGRQGTFSSPPEYDPAHETILSVTFESPKRAFVDARREAALGNGVYRYVLYRNGKRWLIDNLKFKEPDGTYSKAIL